MRTPPGNLPVHALTAGSYRPGVHLRKVATKCLDRGSPERHITRLPTPLAEAASENAPGWQVFFGSFNPHTTQSRLYRGHGENKRLAIANKCLPEICRTGTWLHFVMRMTRA